MRSDDIAAVGVVLAVLGSTIAIAGPLLSRRHIRAKQRLDLLEESLKHPQLDAPTRNQILSVLAKEHEASKLGFLKSAAFWHRITFGAGWLMFIFCGGMVGLSWSRVVPGYIADEAMVWSLMGLALMTLPVAMRELSRQKGRVAD